MTEFQKLENKHYIDIKRLIRMDNNIDETSQFDIQSRHFVSSMNEHYENLKEMNKQ